MKKPIPPEEDEQVAIAQYLDIRVGHYNWCHVPNGGARNVVVGKKLKTQGVKAGVPDVLIFRLSKKVLRSGYNGVAVEMKRQNMKPSDVKPDQKEWLKHLQENGWLTYVASGAGDAIEWLKSWGY